LAHQIRPVAPTGLGLSGARVIVAGAGGLGRQIARAFAEQDVRVAVIDANAGRAEEVLADLPPVTSGDHLGLTADLTSPSACARTVAAATGGLGGLDAGVHAIGINSRRPVLEVDDWEEILSVNAGSAFYFGQAVGACLTRQGHGSLIYLSSVAGLLGHPHHAPYAASKGAINQMMRVMASEWASSGVTVNAVAPGYVETPLTRGYLARDGNRARLEGLVPAGRLGSAEEVSGPVLFLASAMARFVTGHVLYVDGGRSLI
jgi:NAD(P)-dependent dehydrogenase (short-subunit alcohol dehydrogenase family)